MAEGRRNAGGRNDPLYIKVPEHQHIVQDIEHINQIIRNMRESIEVLNEVQEVKEKTVGVFIENVQRLNQQLEDIDGRLPEVHDIEVHMEDGKRPVSEGDDEVIDESIQELRGDLEGLRDELGRLD